MSPINTASVEDAALTWFRELGYAFGHGPNMAPCESATEQESFGDVVLTEHFREAIWRLNRPFHPISSG